MPLLRISFNYFITQLQFCNKYMNKRLNPMLKNTKDLLT